MEVSGKVNTETSGRPDIVVETKAENPQQENKAKTVIRKCKLIGAIQPSRRRLQALIDKARSI